MPAKPPKAFDVWFVVANTVYKAVPYNVVADWTQQGRLAGTDMVRPTGTQEAWVKVSEYELLADYLPLPVARVVPAPEENLIPAEVVGEERPQAPAGPTVELPDPEPGPTVSRFEEDDEVDMIPLIDISLVLLIFFMMTTTVAAISRISVPEMTNASKVDPSGQTLVIYLDQTGPGQVEYAVGKGTTAPAGPDAKLTEKEVLLRLDALMSEATQAVKVRIAAHQDLPYEVVERIMKELERRKQRGVQISEYTLEVGERRGQ